MTIPVVSVVVTAFNSERYLADALTSVGAQSFQNFEIIVVDDGSFDRKAELLVDQFNVRSGLQARYFYKRNGGPSSARNFGISRAKGEYVAFLDADDLFAEEKLAIQVAMLESLPPGYACVIGAANKFGARGVRKGRVQIPSQVDGQLDMVDFFSGRIGIEGTPGYLFRRESLESIGGYDEELRNNEDFDLLLRLVRNYRIKTHNQVTFHHRLRSDSLSKADPVKNLENALRFIEKYAVEVRDLPEQVIARRKQRAYFNAAFLRLKQGALGEYIWLVKKGRETGGGNVSMRGRMACILASLLPFPARNPGITENVD